MIGFNGVGPVVPASATVTAVSLMVTVAGPTKAGYLAVFPEGVARKEGSVANYDPAKESLVTASVIAKVGADGRVSLFANGSTHVVIDVQGYFQSTPPPAPPAPSASSTAFPSNAWAAHGASGTLTLSVPAGTAPAVTAYKWALDDPSLATASLVNVSGNAAGSVSLSPGDGWHTLYAAAVNSAGNTSPFAAYPFGVGVAITSPSTGTRVSRLVKLGGKAPSSFASVTWNYRRSTTDAWTAVPSSQVTNAGTPIPGWPMPVATAGATSTAPDLVWDAAATLGADTTVLLQACYTPTGGGAATCVADVDDPTVTLDQVGAGSTDASTTLAGGSLDLITGNLSLSATDVSVPTASSSLSLSRTFNTLDPARTADTATGSVSVFGPGWSTGLPVEAAGSDWSGLADKGSTVVVTGSDQSSVTFAQVSGGGYRPTGDDADSGLTLLAGAAGPAGTVGPASFTVSDMDGNSTVFTPTASFTATASPAAPHGYAVSTVSAPGSGQLTSYTYNSAGQPVQILAPVPAGSTCTSTVPFSSPSTWTGDCRALVLTYGNNGNAAGRLTAVTLRTTDTTGAELEVDVACYAYDAATRLAAVWDPRNGTAGTGTHPVQCGSQVLPTAYGYDGSGRLSTVTPPGLAATTLHYDAFNRVASVTRTHGASFNNGATETTSIVYGVSTASDPANPSYRPDMSATAVATWGQTQAPTMATAVFGPGHTADVSNVVGATVSYLDGDGRVVNTATYAGTGAAGWHVTTTDYDSHGNVVRALSAANREEALNPVDGADQALGLPTDTVAAAAALSTVNVYSYDAASGVGDLTDTYGPFHLVQLPGGTVTGARLHTHTGYDTGSELGHPLGAVMHQPITVTSAASLSPLASPVAETDVRTTVNAYALSTTDAAGWTFRTPMKVTTDPAGLAISAITRFDATTGAVIETRQPKANATGTDAATTQTIYYTAGANSLDAACGAKPAWAGLLCETLPGGQPGVAGVVGLVTKRVTSYDYLSRPLVVAETGPDGQSRTTTTTYLASGYGSRVDTVATTASTGTAIPTTSTSYDPATGLPVRVSVAATGTQAATSAATGYDDFGRVISYTDNEQASGGQVNTTTTSYGDTTGLVASVTDAHGSTTYAYNQGGESRDLATTVTPSGLGGSFTASFDGDGNLVTQAWPNGLTQTRSLDESGQVTNLSDRVNGRSWLVDAATPSIRGQVLADNLTGEASYADARAYSYDQAGRLTKASDTLSPSGAGACSTRTYGFDADSNRVDAATYAPATGGGCQTTTAASHVTHAYDIADRLTSAGSDAGVVYDGFGRITTLPAGDTGNAGAAATIAYYANDLVRSQTQAGTTVTYSLDAEGRLVAHVSSAGGSWTNHYATAGSDSPAWIGENAAGTTWTRNITGPDGTLAATVDQAGTVTWQVTNLHGDVAATAVGTVDDPAAYYLTDEYGNTLSGYATPGRYGWLGGHQRAHDDLAGLTLMGVRLYTPALGRFLSVDPIPGGNPNAYTYPVDPVNGCDTTGLERNDRLGCGELFVALQKSLARVKLRYKQYQEDNGHLPYYGRHESASSHHGPFSRAQKQLRAQLREWFDYCYGPPPGGPGEAVSWADRGLPPHGSSPTRWRNSFTINWGLVGRGVMIGGGLVACFALCWVAAAASL